MKTIVASSEIPGIQAFSQCQPVLLVFGGSS
jgi:hypothetical protein